MFTCPMCPKDFVSRGCLVSHTRRHTKEKPHKCVICSATFGHANSLKIHITCVHNGNKIIRKKNFNCPLCSYKCSANMKLQIHLRKHSDHFPLSCNEPSCGFKTKYEESLKKHVRVFHNDERPYVCPSGGCSYKSKRRGDLKSHLKIHSTEKPFTCNIPGCDYACKMKAYLTAHISRAHSDEKPFKCSLCDFKGKLRPDLIQHQLTHMNTKRFQCQAPNCSFASSQKKVVKVHFDRKHRKKDVSCTELRCNFRCGSIALLKNHVKMHELPMLKCPGGSCRFSTNSKTYLLRHVSRFHPDLQSTMVPGPGMSDLESAGVAGAMETLQCSFPDCGFHTKLPHHYDRHRKSHNDEKRKHVCSFCFSRFSRLYNLKTHVQRHIQEKPYSCSHCEYTAVNSFELVRHAKKAHHIYVTPRGKEDELKMCQTCETSFLSHSQFLLHSMSHVQPVVLLEQLTLLVL